MHLTALTSQCYFKWKTCVAKYDHRNLICEEFSYTGYVQPADRGPHAARSKALCGQV